MPFGPTYDEKKFQNLNDIGGGEADDESPLLLSRNSISADPFAPSPPRVSNASFAVLSNATPGEASPVKKTKKKAKPVINTFPSEDDL
jgi:hypothetical protein